MQQVKVELETQENINSLEKMMKLVNLASAFTMMIMSLIIGSSLEIEATKNPQLFPAAFIFGDSLIDPGNNIPFADSLAKANFPPYGIDDTGPTGRFSNGKTFIDFLGELSGLPPLPSYADTITKGADIMSGVNYASAGAGILQDSGLVFIHVIPLSKQIENFKNTLNQLSKQMKEEEMRKYLSNALVVLAMGANDYIDNYLMPPFRTILNPQRFADLLIDLYSQNILEIKNLGLRKLLILDVAPAGCMPLVVDRGVAPPVECLSSMNIFVQMFNTRLRSLVDTLNSDYPQTLFTLAATFQPFIDLRDASDTYGFKVKDKACCVGIASNSSMYPKACLPLSVPCSNRDEYLFWDFAHPTQAVNQILTNQLFNGTSDCYPYTFRQLANM